MEFIWEVIWVSFFSEGVNWVWRSVTWFPATSCYFSLCFSIPTFWKRTSDAAQQTRNEVGQHRLLKITELTSFTCRIRCLSGSRMSNRRLAILFSCGFLGFWKHHRVKVIPDQLVDKSLLRPSQPSTAVVTRNLRSYEMMKERHIFWSP